MELCFRPLIPFLCFIPYVEEITFPMEEGIKYTPYFIWIRLLMTEKQLLPFGTQLQHGEMN